VTLNVNLEDVPWAILEVVKARIMANRKKLEEAQEQSLEAQLAASAERPQYRSIGASTRRRVDPEPGSVRTIRQRDAGTADWVIYWTAEGGRTTVSPADLTQTGEYLTTEFQGQLARTGAAEVGEAFFEASIEDTLLIGGGNFTFEGWLAEGSTDADNLSDPPEGAVDGDVFIIANAGIQFAWNGGSIQHVISRNYIVDTDENVYRRTGSLVVNVSDGIEFTSDVPASAGEPVRHFCYQRIGSNSYFHFNGIPQSATYGSGGPGPFPVGGELQTLQMIAFMETRGVLSPGTIIGQARVKTGALYGAGAFTPPAAPFFNP
jgi:hypothetical protein